MRNDARSGRLANLPIIQFCIYLIAGGFPSMVVIVAKTYTVQARKHRVTIQSRSVSQQAQTERGQLNIVHNEMWVYIPFRPISESKWKLKQTFNIRSGWQLFLGYDEMQPKDVRHLQVLCSHWSRHFVSFHLLNH